MGTFGESEHLAMAVRWYRLTLDDGYGFWRLRPKPVRKNARHGGREALFRSTIK